MCAACFVLLWFTSSRSADTVSYKLKVCSSPTLSNALFPTAYAHFLSLRHIVVILVAFQTFSLLLCLLCC